MSDRAQPPVIGIGVYRTTVPLDGERQILADALPATYAKAISAAGGVPVLIPPVGDGDAARAIVAMLHGLVLAGGEDVNPATYAGAPHAEVTTWCDERDRGELLLLDAADERALPVLGICRGMQVMAVHGGGTLIPHLPDVVGHDRHVGRDGKYADNEVAVIAGSRLAGSLPVVVAGASWHHQAVAEHPGFVAAARDADGVLQAMESPGERFAIAVQWHPEQRPDVGVFAALLDAAREFQSAARAGV